MFIGERVIIIALIKKKCQYIKAFDKKEEIKMTGCNNKRYRAAYRAYRRMILPYELNKNRNKPFTNCKKCGIIERLVK